MTRKSFFCRSIALCCVLLLLLSIPAYISMPSAAQTLEGAEEGSPAGRLSSKVYYRAYDGAVIIGCMEQGTQVAVLGESGDYYKIDCYDMNGYLPKSQVTVTENGECYVSCQKDSEHTTYLPSVPMEQALELRSLVQQTGKKYLGVPYVWGGSSPKGFDCSGFTQYVLRKCGMEIHRTAYLQMQDGAVIAREDLRCGDLVFFSNTGGRGFGSHVGIYLGDGNFIHAGSSTGITISTLESGYFDSHYQCARRVILGDISVSASIPDAGMLYLTEDSYWLEQ